MPKLVGTIACLLVAIDCAEKAVGTQPQEIFASEHVWVWWIAAAFWGFNALLFLRARIAA